MRYFNTCLGDPFDTLQTNQFQHFSTTVSTHVIKFVLALKQHISRIAFAVGILGCHREITSLVISGKKRQILNNVTVKCNKIYKLFNYLNDNVGRNVRPAVIMESDDDIPNFLLPTARTNVLHVLSMYQDKFFNIQFNQFSTSRFHP